MVTEDAVESSGANGVAEAHKTNGKLWNGDSDVGNGGKKLTPAEKKRLKKKQRKANKQAGR